MKCRSTACTRHPNPPRVDSGRLRRIQIFQVSGFAAIDDSSVDDGNHGSAAKFAAFEWSVGRLTWGLFYVEHPRVIRREERQIGRLAGSYSALFSQDAIRAGSKKLPHAPQREAPGAQH